MNTWSQWKYVLKIWFSGYLNIVTNERRNQITPKSDFKKVSKIVKEFCGNLIRGFSKDRIPKHKIWFLSLSSNNYISLKEVQKNLDNSIFVSFKSIKDKAFENTYLFSLRWRFLYNLLFPFKLLIVSKNRNEVRQFYDLFFQAEGTYQECYRLLKKFSPKAIVFGNDHVIIARSLLLAANELGIKSYYIQHASVSEYFPPLDFSYALLEGKDSLAKYKKAGNILSKVVLVGMPKFDSFINRVNNNSTVNNLGIAFNAMDDLNEVKKIVNFLIEEFPNLTIHLRPHPSDYRNINDIPVTISNPRKENSFEFLSKIDVIIAGDSSIHLEAVLLNVYAIQYDFGLPTPLDYYGFISNNLVSYSANFSGLRKLIKSLIIEKPNIQVKAKYYNEAVESDFYGASTNKIIDIIEKTINLENGY